VFGSRLGRKYGGTYLAISHTNIEIPMESSELTGLRSKQISYGRRSVVQSTPKFLPEAGPGHFIELSFVQKINLVKS
jgi:hypothetical protein